MLSRSVTVALGLLGLSMWSCATKDESTTVDPGPPVDEPRITRNVVDSGLVYLDMDADIHGRGGSTELEIPDAGPKPDRAPLADAPADLGGPGAACDVFATNPCAPRYGCYPKSDGSGTCQEEGFLPGGSQCEPMSSSPDSRCTPGYTCVNGLCTGLCHVGSGNSECGTSIGTTCIGIGISTVVGYCDWQ